MASKQRYEKPSEIRKRMENAARRKLRKLRYLETAEDIHVRSLFQKAA
jgi:ribosomal protein S21